MLKGYPHVDEERVGIAVKDAREGVSRSGGDVHGEDGVNHCGFITVFFMEHVPRQFISG